MALAFISQCICYAPDLAAQNSSLPAQIEIFPVITDSSYFLGDWVEANSIQVNTASTKIPRQNWHFDEENGSIRFVNTRSFEFSPKDTLYINYNAYPIALKKWYKPPTLPNYKILLGNTEQLSYDKGAHIDGDTDNIFSGSNLQQYGSLSRGIVVGTNQDFALESGLNFELKGNLTENINIEAAITDKNIPIQPDGTTQNLREFDKVLINLYSVNSNLQMGDIDVKFDRSSFAKLNRRLQGAAGNRASSSGNYSGAVSVMRGTYHSVKFDGNDGMQGPYRLTGKNGESFVIVLAGTEQVFINGRQVSRGEENEYIIDYGLGEVTFTNNLLITDETRITIEYEYIDRNFNRTLMAVEVGESFFDDRISFGATVIRQADGNELLSQQTLSESDIEILKNVGNNLDLAIASGAAYVSESDRESTVRYALRDTTENNQLISIYIQSSDSNEAIYKVTFTHVGANKGSYKRVGSTVNGMIYEWVGKHNGDYEPYRKLPAPQKQQMAAFNSEYRIGKNASIYGEWAVSEFDQNRFSTLGKENNVDMAYTGGIKINNQEIGLGKLNFDLNRRYSGRNFQYFERTKEVEFDRKWNIQNQTDAKELLNEAKVDWLIGENAELSAEYGLIELTGFKGQRQASKVELNNLNGFSLVYNQDWVNTTNNPTNEKGDWLRQDISLSKEFNFSGLQYSPYLYIEHEIKSDKELESDSLLNNSLSFIDVGPGFAFGKDALRLDYSISYRNQQGVLDNKFHDEYAAMTHRFIVNYAPSNNFYTQNQLKWRKKNVNDTFASANNIADKNNLLLKSNTGYRLFSDKWQGEILYEAGTKREALYQETYIEVGPEFGQYVWDDLNGDGVQQIDEFFPELTANEGTYIRQLLPSDELFSVIDLNFGLRNEIMPFGFLPDDSALEILGFLKQIRLFSNIRIQESSTTNRLSDVYFLKLSTFRNDATTLHGRFLLDKELDLLPGYDRGDLRLKYSYLGNFNKRSSETIKAGSTLFSMEARYRITDVLEAELNAGQGKTSNTSSQLSTRNYDIGTKNLEIGLHSTINRSWRSGLIGNYTLKRDESPNIPVNAKIFKIKNMNRVFLFKKIQANGSIELRNSIVNGIASNYGLFELTEGTGEGYSVLWHLNGSYNLGNSIKLSFMYNGRTAENRKTINTFKIVVNAVF